MFKKQNETSKLSKNKKRLLIILLSFLIVFALIFALVCFLLGIGKNKLLNQNNGSIYVPENIVDSNVNDGKTVVYKGKKYQYNENITSILFMGIDKDRIDSDAAESYGENGQADVLILMAIDTTNGNMKAIPISRDTMVDVNLYSESGQYVGVSKEQICLSYAYGDGREKSCENVVKSASRLLYGMPINSYLAIDINTIRKLNDSIGGVTLVIDEDIKLYDKIIKAGDKVTLEGSYAIKYIRGRDKEDIEANNVRMSRQKKYMYAFYQQVISMTKKDITTPVKLYSKISGEKVSNLSIADITYLTKCVLLKKENDSIKFSSISGKTVAGEEFVEFYPDENELYDLVINTYYTPCQE